MSKQKIHDLAGHRAPRSFLVNIPRLVAAYYLEAPDVSEPGQRVSFGTSGHRGSSFKKSFNEAHILAIAQAISEYRSARKIDGPLFIGMDTHALSEAALASAIEVFAGQEIHVAIQEGLRYTPTPVISHAILTYNRGRKSGLADGVVITPSHNPPEDGGFKYNPPEGGPANTETTRLIESRANELLSQGKDKIRRLPFEKAMKSGFVRQHDYVAPYVSDLENIIDMNAIAAAKLKVGVDPLGGAAVDYWEPIAERYGLHLEIVNKAVDPTFSFMTLDKDGKIRMDCSSPYAMNSLVGLKDRFDLAFGNDTDVDRHGIVTKSGLMNPNHYLAAAIRYLFTNRPQWNPKAAVGKTIVSTSMIDCVVADLQRPLQEVPVGFKWFVDGLIDGSCGFGGEESAGASFLRFDGDVWTTDKDGIIMDLLACEMTAKMGMDPSQAYGRLEEKYGRFFYDRQDIPATAEEKAAFKLLEPEKLGGKTLAGEPVTAVLTKAPANGADIGGVKIISPRGWFAARPSGTEEIYKIYAESFVSESHLQVLEDDARKIVADILARQ